MGPEFSSTNLDRAGHFGPFHGSNRRRSGKQMITLDLNHFGFLRAGRPERRKRGGEEGKGKDKGGHKGKGKGKGKDQKG